MTNQDGGEGMKFTSSNEYEKWRNKLDSTSTGFITDMLILAVCILITILRRLEAKCC